MANGGRRVEPYYERGMLEVRSSLHLATRLAVRLNQLLQHSGAASAGTGLWRAALPLFVVLDVVEWHVLRRSDRFGLPWRLPVDALDAAFWAASPHPASGHYDWALLIAIPLGIEAGVRLGWKGLVVPTSLLGSTAISAELTGKGVRLSGVAWIVLSVAMGMAFLRYCRHLDVRAERQRQRLLDAARRRAYLAGQNSVAMGASSAVDAIEGLVPVLGRPAVGSAFWRLADGWKGELSASTVQEARYLQVALLEWERLHNRHPDLSGLVRVSVDEGAGTTLLTPGQVAQLSDALEALGLRGPVHVGLRDADAGDRLPGQALRLDVDGHLVALRPDRAEHPPFDPCAITYLYLVLLVLAMTFDEVGGLPVPAALAGAAVCAVVGIVSHRMIVSRGERARLTVFLLAVATATVLTALSGLVRSPVNVDGDAVVAFGMSLLLLSFLGGFYWPSLGRWRWTVPAAMAANTVLGLVVFPAPAALTAQSVTAMLAYNLLPFFPCRHLAAALEGAATSHAESVDALDVRAERAEFLAGRESVVALVREARRDALRQLRRLEPDLEVELAALAVRRLEEVERRLQGIESEPVSSSSTTTG